ncbi:class F sortase [Actinoplanes flavus]|uniref:Class F sortase n=1 Tax=Actinoplanes flavus TaxID=2820290 RepID=A0ABS3UK27_9ACTN|nr:class F sortase [Actinoplanes flavus]MBO3739140.1 class F sortase [Actinoplanes flavus]
MRRRWSTVAVAAVLAGCAGGTPAPDPAGAATPSVSGPAGAGVPSGSMAGPAGAETLTSGELVPASAPERVAIPALDVSAPVVALGLRADGTMEVPGDATTVGWFTGAPAPGSLGPAVLAGHVDYRGVSGTFAGLSALRPGDEVRITRRDGRTAVFAVTRVATYPKSRFPSGEVYGPIDHAGLRLITCGGDFDRRTGHYVDNVVAYARLRQVMER